VSHAQADEALGLTAIWQGRLHLLECAIVGKNRLRDAGAAPTVRLQRIAPLDEETDPIGYRSIGARVGEDEIAAVVSDLARRRTGMRGIAADGKLKEIRHAIAIGIGGISGIARGRGRAKPRKAPILQLRQPGAGQVDIEGIVAGGIARQMQYGQARTDRARSELHRKGGATAAADHRRRRLHDHEIRRVGPVDGDGKTREIGVAGIAHGEGLEGTRSRKESAEIHRARAGGEHAAHGLLHENLGSHRIRQRIGKILFEQAETAAVLPTTRPTTSANQSTGRQAQAGELPTTADARASAQRIPRRAAIGRQIKRHLRDLRPRPAAHPLELREIGHGKRLSGRIVHQHREAMVRLPKHSTKKTADEHFAIGQRSH